MQESCSGISGDLRGGNRLQKFYIKMQQTILHVACLTAFVTVCWMTSYLLHPSLPSAACLKLFCVVFHFLICLVTVFPWFVTCDTSGPRSSHSYLGHYKNYYITFLRDRLLLLIQLVGNWQSYCACDVLTYSLLLQETSMLTLVSCRSVCLSRVANTASK